MDTKKFDTCVFRTKEKHPRIQPPHVCGRCPKAEQTDVYKCLKLVIDMENSDICVACVHYVSGE